MVVFAKVGNTGICIFVVTHVRPWQFRKGTVIQLYLQRSRFNSRLLSGLIHQFWVCFSLLGFSVGSVTHRCCRNKGLLVTEHRACVQIYIYVCIYICMYIPSAHCGAAAARASPSSFQEVGIHNEKLIISHPSVSGDSEQLWQEQRILCLCCVLCL